jgi:hypothetical protein
MEPQSLSRRSQGPSNGPYPEQNHFSRHNPILSLQDPSLYYTHTYIFVFLVASFVPFILGFSPTAYMHSSSLLSC